MYTSVTDHNKKIRVVILNNKYNRCMLYDIASFTKVKDLLVVSTCILADGTLNL